MSCTGMNYVDDSLNSSVLGGEGDASAGKQLSKSQKKKALRKQKKKEEQKEPEVAFEIEEITEQVMKVSLADQGGDNPPKEDTKQQTTTRKKKASSRQRNPYPASTDQEEVSTETASPDLDKVTLKQVRALRKKLKQITELERKLASGEITNPEPEQLTKLARKEELMRELEELTPSS